MKKIIISILLLLVLVVLGQSLLFNRNSTDQDASSIGAVLAESTMVLQDGQASYGGAEDRSLHTSFKATDEILSIGGPTAWPMAIRFDLSGIQTDAVVTSATLSLYYSQDYPNETGSNNKPVSLYKMLKPWVESQANNTNYATGLTWATAYGRGANTDRVSSASASLAWKTGELGWKDFDVTSDVQSFINGSSQNNGWSVDLGTTYDAYFYSSENIANPTLRPKLTVNYNSDSPLPPPPVVDSQAPVFSNINVGSISSTGAMISWVTDEDSDTQVEYGVTTSYGKSTTLKDTTTKVTSHSVALSGLVANTQYNFIAKSKDALGNLGTSVNTTFTTLEASAPPPPTTPPPVLPNGVPGEPTPVPTLPTSPEMFRLSGSPIGQIFLNGSTYSLKDHPRVWFDGPNGTLTSKVKDPDGSGPAKGPKVDTNFAPYQALRSRLDAEIVGCDTKDNCDGAYPSTDRNEAYAAMAALDWFMDNSRVKSKNYAIWKLNTIEKKIAYRYQLGCIENYQACELNSFGDWPAETMIYTALAYTMVRSEMTPDERNIFAQKILNGYGDNDKCINQNVRTAAITNYPGSGYKVTGSGFSSAGLVVGDLIAIYDVDSAAPSYGYIQSVDSDTELTVSPQESNLQGVFVPFTSGLGGANTQSVSNGALHRLTPQWLPGMCGQFWQIMHHGYQPATVTRRDIITPLAAGFSATDTKIRVQNASVFAGINTPFLISTIRDKMRVTAINGNELTVERGICDSTPLAISGTNSSVTYLKYPCDGVSTNLNHNLVIQKLQGYLTLSLALLDDDSRAQLAFQRSIVDLQTAVSSSKEIWTGFLQGGSSDYYGRWSINVPSMVAAVKQSVSGSPSLDFWSGNWLKDLVYYRLYIGTPGKNKQNVPWGEARDIVNKFRVHGGLIAMMQYFYPNSPESAYGQFYGEDYTGLYTASGISSVPALIPWEVIFSSKNDPKTDFTAVLPTQRAFNKTDTIDGDGLSRAYNGWISRTGFNDANDTQIFSTALSTFATDHGISGTGHTGSYKVYKNGWIIAENGGAWSGVGLGANVLQFGTTINMITAPNFQSPLIDRAGGDAAARSSWGYERTNLSKNVYTSAASVSTALRNIVHFKKQNTPDYIVVFDEMASVSPIQKGIRLHYDKASGESKSMTKTTLPDLEWKAPNRMISTKVLLPVLGKVVKTEETATYTFNNYICASQNGSSCDTANTGAEFLLVHKPSVSTTDTMPNISLTANNADWSCGQIEDATSPKSVCFSKKGDKNSIGLTTTHSGTAQYLFVGLVPGNYIVKKDGVQIASPTVNWNDNSLYFESTKGLFQIAINGSPLPPPIETPTTPTLPPAELPIIIFPVISGIATPSVGTSTATITWNTDINTDTQVEYGLTTIYGSSSTLKDSSTKVKTHTVTLTGLTPGVKYNFRVRSRDDSNNLALSINQSFTTSLIVGNVIVVPSVPVTPPPTSPGGNIVSQTANTPTTTTVPSDIRKPTDQPKTTIGKLPPISKNLSRGSKTSEVSTLQQFLISQSLLSSDSVTGFFGPLTEEAVKAFQRKYGIVSSGSPSTTGYGSIGPKTRMKINELLGVTTTTTTTQTTTPAKGTKLTKPLSRGVTGSDVITLQNVLIKEGLLAPGNNTGFFGPLTEAAVKAFQKKYNIVLSGTASTTGFGVTGPKTRAKVNEKAQ